MRYIILFIIICCTTTQVQCQYSIPSESLSYSVLISIKSGNNEFCGSGFFISDSSSLYLVTAKHVLLNENINSKTNQINYSLIDTCADVFYYPRKTDKNPPNILTLDLGGLYKSGNFKISTDKDVVVARIGINSEIGYKHVEYNDYVTKRSNTSSINFFIIDDIKKFESIEIGNDVFIFGYPKSLGMSNNPQYDFNRPLLRKGSIAGKNQTLKTIVLDCPSYGGNSGGPVIEFTRERPYLVGLVVEFIPFEEKWLNLNYKIVNIDYLNSGYSVIVPMDYVLELMKMFK